MSKIKLLAAVSLMAICAVPASIVMAQNANTYADEIIVTATKRNESIKDVPVSVATLSAEQMDSLAIVDIRDASVFIPNFEFSSDPILPNLYIRGLGAGISQIIEQSIGTFVDGVYMGRATTSSLGFMDVSGLEVLRGTQGTLFGKNTVAGALIINTNNPTPEFEAGLDLLYGVYSTVGDYHQAEGYISGPISENLSGRIAVRYRNADGYVENRLDGPDGAARKDIAIRGKLLWQAGESTDFNLKLEHAEYETEGQISMEILGFPRDRDPVRFDYYKSISPNFEDTLNWQGDLDCTVPEANGFCPKREQDYQNVTLIANHDLGFAKLTSVSGFQKYFYDDQFVSVDVGLAGGAFQATRVEDYSSFSQELRIASNKSADNKFDYIAGVYFDTVDLTRDQMDHFNIPLATDGHGPRFDREENWTLDTKTKAIFGEVSVPLSEKFTFNFGGRYSSETKEYSFVRFIDPYYSDTQTERLRFPLTKRKESKFTPSASLEWSASDNVNVYYAYAEGHKTGGFSDRLGNVAGANVEFNAEQSKMHEIGIKATMDRFDFNITAFNMAMSDLQVARVGTPTECGVGSFCFIVQNAAEVTSKGVELDGRFHASDNLTFGAAYAYTDATYDSFVNAGCKIQVGGICDISGETLIFAPKHKGNIYAQYTTELSEGWGLTGLASLAFSSSYFGSQELAEEVKQEAYQILNASLKLDTPYGFDVSLIGRNLTEQAVLSFGIPVPGNQPYAFGASGAPREIALKVGFDF